MKLEGIPSTTPAFPRLSEFARKLLKPLGLQFRGNRRPHPRLELVDRIALAPRQSLALIEADGRLLLVATSAEGGPVFYPIDTPPRPALRSVARVSW